MTAAPRFDARIVDCTPEEYFARPGFSSSIAKILISRSPAHAKANVSRRPSWDLDRGSVIHRLALGKGKDFEVAPAHIEEWRTNEAKAFRDGARAAGKTPLKAKEFVSWGSAAERIRNQLADRGLVLDGISECAIEWYEPTPHGPLLCKAMLDHLWIAEGRILDLKITENAAPAAVERTAENLGYAIQAAAYSRALSRIRPDLVGRVDFLFAFCEAETPWALNLCRPDGVFSGLGEERWLRACAIWAKCQAENEWPGYGRDVNFITAPPWALTKELSNDPNV